MVSARDTSFCHGRFFVSNNFEILNYRKVLWALYKFFTIAYSQSNCAKCDLGLKADVIVLA